MWRPWAPRFQGFSTHWLAFPLDVCGGTSLLTTSCFSARLPGCPEGRTKRALWPVSAVHLLPTSQGCCFRDAPLGEGQKWLSETWPGTQPARVGYSMPSSQQAVLPSASPPVSVDGTGMVQQLRNATCESTEQAPKAPGAWDMCFHAVLGPFPHLKLSLEVCYYSRDIVAREARLSRSPGQSRVPGHKALGCPGILALLTRAAEASGHRAGS